LTSFSIFAYLEMKELKFIHITKTAGTSIEEVGRKKKISWGRFHIEYGRHHALFPNKPESLKQQYDWFMVVRNPYTRILSEYHFLNNVLKFGNTKEDMNRILTLWIINASEDKANHPIFGRVGGDHFTEQYKYLDPTVNIRVLKFENIEDEFNALMKEYNYDLVLNERLQVSEPIFTIADISAENIELIQKVYSKDFELFGYIKDPQQTILRMISYETLKEKEAELCTLINSRIACELFIDKITDSDIYYTDGAVKSSIGKIIFKVGGKHYTVYVFSDKRLMGACDSIILESIDYFLKKLTTT
jgi:hypothetical protein